LRGSSPPTYDRPWVTPSDVHTRVVAPVAARRAYLVVLAGDRMGEMFGLLAGTTAIGRGLQAEVRINDEGISRIHALIVQEGDVYYLSDAGSTNGTFVGGVKIDRYPLLEGDRIQLGATSVLKFTYRDDSEEELQRRLYESALRDRPTGLFNHSYFQSRLEGDVAVALRQGRPLALLLFGVDRLDERCAELGVSSGEGLLRELGQRVAAIVREDDVLARFNEELLGLLCRGVDAMRAERPARRILAIASSTPLVVGGRALTVTLSLGIADLALLREPTADALLAAADVATVQARRAGGDRIVIYDPENEATQHT